MFFKKIVFIFSCWVTLLCFPNPLFADDVSEYLGLAIHRYQLENGFTLVVVPRKQASPVFSTHLRVKVGSIEEPKSASGLAHFFEHMAFKGTSKIGSQNFEAEKEILIQLSSLGDQITKLKKQNPHSPLIKEYQQKFDELKKEHSQLMIQNEFVKILNQHGAVGLNATTSTDFTSYFVSLPASSFELWAYMESERFLDPVLREFFKERDVVREERRMRYDNSPDGFLYENMLAFNFNTSPYRLSPIGKSEHIQNYDTQTAIDFFKKNYVPKNMVLAIVGEIDPDDAYKVIQKTFGRLQNSQNQQENFVIDHSPESTLEPTGLENSKNQKKIVFYDALERFYLTFKRPGYDHPDDVALYYLQALLCEGRLSRLKKRLVYEEKVVSQFGCYDSLPGSRLASVFSFYGVPIKPYTSEEITELIHQEIKKLIDEGISPRELKRVRDNLNADLIWSVKSNSGLASMLTYVESLTGHWQNLITYQQKINKTTADQVLKAAQKYFEPKKHKLVILKPKS